MRQPVPFGKYLLLDRISVGGMAEVFKAKSYGVEGFEKIIAIKRILPTMGEDRDFIKMFIDEAKIAGQLAHANICQIFELGRIDGSHFIAMEYIWGKDLLQIQNRLRKIKQQMPIPMACFAIAKVLEGLDYAHRKRDPLGRPLEIVHRDCSPQNVLVSYEGEVKVIDFGIAKATSRNSRTMAGVLKGKFGYMSPEQVRGLPLDRRSDIFAIGTMLYECLTGERLFQGETDFSTLEKVRNVDIQAPRAINPAIPEAVEKVILKALAKDVDDRYQWCGEMLADLQQYLMGQDVVFTAKSLSSWLKETFAQEIERERQQLEAYKRVGRDGLIAGVPAAEAKLDVVEHLGEAGKPEGDATTLGGPNFDDIEAAAGASPQLGAPPAAGRPKASGDHGWEPATTAGGSDEGDFGEEAPTEIFGEDAAAAILPEVAAAVSRAPAPGGKAPPKPPPGGGPAAGRAPSIGPGASGSPPAMAAAPGPSAGPSVRSTPNPGGDGLQAATVLAPSSSPMPIAAPPVPGGPNNGFAPNGGMPGGSIPPPVGVAGSGMGAPPGAPVGPGDSGQMGLSGNMGRTVLGMVAPVGVPNYATGGFRPSGPMPGQPMQPSSLATPPGGMQMPPPGHNVAGYPQQQPGGYPGYPDPNQYNSPYPGMPQQGYGGYSPPTGGAVEPLAPQGEGKKSTLVRDIGIGVAIAAIVLVGFLVVKVFVLDKGSGDSKDTASSSMATIKISLTQGVSAELFVDDKKVANVSDGQAVPLSPGLRRVKLVGPNNARCEQPIKLDPGATTTLECTMAGVGSAAAVGSGSAEAAVANPTATGSAGAGSGSAAALVPTTGSGSAAATGSGSATAGAGSGSATAGSGSAAVAETKVTPTEVKTPAGAGSGSAAVATTHPPETHTATTHPPDTHPAGTGSGAGTTATHANTGTGTTTTTATHATETHATGTGSAGTAHTTTGTGTTSSSGNATKQVATTDDATKGYLQLSSKPSAKIFLDGADTGKKTPAKLSVPPGKHKVSFQLGDDKYSYPVSVKAGETVNVDKDLQ